MRESRVLVTGANGLIGRALMGRLRLAWPSAELAGIDLGAPSGVDGEVCDLGDPVATRGAIARLAPDVVFHCAGGVAGQDLDDLTARLVAPTRVVLSALVEAAPRAVLVVPGSAAEYGTLAAGRSSFVESDEPAPVSPYGAAKAAQTRAVLEAAEAGIDARLGRVFNIIGPGLPATLLVGHVAAQLAAVARGEAAQRIELGSLASVRDFVDIRDACDGLIAVAEKGVSGRVYNICSGVGRTSRECVDALVRCSGMDVAVAEKADGSPRAGIDASVGDPRRIADECGWRSAISFDTSACDAVAVAREDR